jgi:hypothetical protein
MRSRRWFPGVLTSLILIVVPSMLVPSMLTSAQQQPPDEATGAESSASPEMNRLAKALAGDWRTVETMERSEFFPNGGGRQGVSHASLGTGGTTLIWEGHSDGSAGKLSYLITIWWDNEARLYRFFTCFNGYDHPCEVRGTAHWEADVFVNDYEETVHGDKKKFRDTFSQITPTSYTLTEAIDAGNGTMKALITTRSARR